MNDQVKSDFAIEQPEKSEIQQIQERLQNHTMPIDGKLVNIVNVIIEQYLRAGLVKPADLEAITLVSQAFLKAQIDYQTFVTSSTKRLQELQQAELTKQSGDVTEKFREYEQRIADEIEESRVAKKELAQLKAQLEALQKNTTAIDSPPKKTRAFDVARALNPAPVETDLTPSISLDTPQSHTKVDISIEEPVEEKSLDDVTPEEWDKAVKQVSTSLTEDEDLLQKVEETKEAFDSFEDMVITEEEPVEVEVEPELRIAEEDEQTQPNFTKPIISGGNAPNLQDIPTYDSEEELLEVAQAKLDAKEEAEEEAEEEEYEEITIPSEAELNDMTKAKIKTTAEGLGFENVVITDTKAVMIENFVSDSIAFIQSLEDTGELVSSSDSELIDSEMSTGNDDDSPDRQDGGYF